MKYKLESIVFTTGACIMIMELVGSRVLAPYLGTSIVVWTSLIGIILASLSVGYWYGGKLADKDPSWQTLATLIFMAGIMVGLIGIIKTPILQTIQQTFRDIRVGSFLSTIILFTPPSIMLGMISPYAVRLKIHDVKTSGATVGQLYAISTVGSIVGTFLSGFVLVSFIGHTKILFLLSIILILTAIYAAPKDALKGKVLAILVAATALSATHGIETIAENNGVILRDTNYSHVQIYTTQDHKTGRDIRVLRTDPFVVQSAVFLDGDDDLVSDYTKFYRLINHFVEEPKEALLIGGAAYTHPRDFVRHNQDAHIDVVEIDPEFTELAREYFGFEHDARITPIHADARTYLNYTDQTYDALFVDAYHSVYSIPYQLTTQEAVQSMYDRLNDNGVLMANIISAVTGEKSQFIRAQLKTYASVFPHVYLFQASPDRDTDDIQNLILVATKSGDEPGFENDNQTFQTYLNRRYTGDLSTDLPILTDDFAPVDQYVLNFID